MMTTSQSFLEDGWSAQDDEWPGLVGHGDTQDEAMRDLQRQIAAEIARRERVG